MQHDTASCQLLPALMGVSSPEKATPEAVHALVRGAAQSIGHTASRRTGPRRWLRAVTWLIAAGLHPRAGNTTIRLAEDLAERMDYDTGHARYCLDATATRLRLNRSTVKRHAAILRELGALAWVQHGTRANIRRALGIPGYAATATVYAAVIPPAYDHAMGHTIVGTGYQARIVVDHRGHGQAPEGPVDNPSGDPAPAPAQGACAPPSLTGLRRREKVEVVGGSNYTSRKRASRQPRSTSPTEASSSGQPRRSPLQVARDIQITRQVRPRVPWTQREHLRRLAHALRPLIDRGLDAHTIAAELTSWWLDWRPAQPAAYIRAQLAGRTRLEAERATAVAPMDNPEWRALMEQQAQTDAVLEEIFAAAQQTRTDEDRRAARDAGWHDLATVAEHYADDPDDALDLYGATLCARAIRMTSSAHVQIGALA